MPKYTLYIFPTITLLRSEWVKLGLSVCRLNCVCNLCCNAQSVECALMLCLLALGKGMWRSKLMSCEHKKYG